MGAVGALVGDGRAGHLVRAAAAPAARAAAVPGRDRNHDDQTDDREYGTDGPPAGSVPVRSAVPSPVLGPWRHHERPQLPGTGADGLNAEADPIRSAA